MKKSFVAGLVLIGVAALLNESLATPPPAFEGLRLYTSYCQLCHGPGGEGDGPLARTMRIKPANLTTTIRSRSDNILKKIISGEGRQTITGRDRHNLISEAMPGWKDVLSDAQIEALIAYLRFLATSKHRLMGNPETGYILYQRYCQVCHGEDGGGDGIMTNLINMRPTDHSNPIAMARLSNEDLVDSIRSGSGEYMPAWKDILTQEEVEALISYIRLLAQ